MTFDFQKELNEIARVITTCKNCGRQIGVLKKDLLKGQMPYCSPKCITESYRGGHNE